MKDAFIQNFVDGKGAKLIRMIDETDQWLADWMKKLPDEYKATAVEMVDQLVMGLAHFSQKKDKMIDHEKKILLEARLFNAEVENIEHMSRLSLTQLQYIEEKFKSKYTLYSMIEGGIAGTGHALGLLLDLPALLTINLRMIQSIASTYGYSIQRPPEQILALKVLHAGTLSKMYQENAWEWMLQEYEQRDEYSIYIQGDDTLIKSEWLETIAKQWLKSMTLYGLKRTSKQKLSLVGIALGAGLNMQITKQVGDFASRFYQYRFQQDHGEEGIHS